MKTCDNCKLWEPGEGYWCPSDFGYCNQPVYGDNHPMKASCGVAGHGESGDPNRLRTGPKFGCIHFMEKIK